MQTVTDGGPQYPTTQFAYKCLFEPVNCTPTFCTSSTLTIHHDGRLQKFSFGGFSIVCLLKDLESFCLEPFQLVLGDVRYSVRIERENVSLITSDSEKKSVKWIGEFLYRKLLGFFYRAIRHLLVDDAVTSGNKCGGNGVYIFPLFTNGSITLPPSKIEKELRRIRKTRKVRSILYILQSATNWQEREERKKTLLGSTIIYKRNSSKEEIARIDGIEWGKWSNNTHNPKSADEHPMITYFQTGDTTSGKRQYAAEFCDLCGLKSDVMEDGIAMLHVLDYIRFFHNPPEIDFMNYTFKNLFLMKEALSYKPLTEMTVDPKRKHEAAYQSKRRHLGRLYQRSDNKTEGTADQTEHRPLKKRKFNEFVSSHDGDKMDNFYRLRLVGQSVTSFLAASQVYFLFPEAKEDLLSEWRATLVQRSTLAQFATAMKILESLQIDKSYFGLDEVANPEQILSKYFKALIGSMYIDGGVSVCRKFYADLLYQSSEEQAEKSFWLAPRKHEYSSVDDGSSLKLSDDDKERCRQIMKATGFEFRNVPLLLKAFTLPSWRKFDIYKIGDYQRLEFLGDAVLEMIVCGLLFARYPFKHGNELEKIKENLVKNSTLSQIFCRMQLRQYTRYDDVGKFVKLGADVIEAFVGALYVDQGLQACRRFIEEHVMYLEPHVYQLNEYVAESLAGGDQKNQLEELLTLGMKYGLVEPTEEMPRYSAKKDKEKDRYLVAVEFCGVCLGRATSNSVLRAERAAAGDAFDTLSPQMIHLINEKRNSERNAKYD